jgi:hypothetical protein
LIEGCQSWLTAHPETSPFLSGDDKAKLRMDDGVLLVFCPQTGIVIAEGFRLCFYQFIDKKASSMKVKALLLSILFLPLLSFLTGCASILDGGEKTVQINSNPEGATVTIFNRSGKEVFAQTTPTIVSLERSSDFFMGEDYRIHFEDAGYYPYEVHVKSTVDGWYVGNIFFGGLIGILIVDPATGDMWTLSPREVNCDLVPIHPSAQQLQQQSQYMQLYSNVVQNVNVQNTK